MRSIFDSGRIFISYVNSAPGQISQDFLFRVYQIYIATVFFLIVIGRISCSHFVLSSVYSYPMLSVYILAHSHTFIYTQSEAAGVWCWGWQHQRLIPGRCLLVFVLLIVSCGLVRVPCGSLVAHPYITLTICGIGRQFYSVATRTLHSKWSIAHCISYPNILTARNCVFAGKQ